MRSHQLQGGGGDGRKLSEHACVYRTAYRCYLIYARVCVISCAESTLIRAPNARARAV